MTVASDLATRFGKHHRLFLKIDGIEPIFWVPSDHPDESNDKAGCDPPGPHNAADPSLIALWRFDEFPHPGSGDNVNAIDSSGNAHTAIPGATIPTITTSGRFGNARVFAAASRIMTVAASTKFQPQRFTISMWVCPTDAAQPSYANLFMRRANIAATRQPMGLDFGSTLVCRPRAYINFTDATYAIVQTAAGYTLTTSAWSHIGVTWDGTTLRVYINGVAAGTDATGAGKTIDWSDWATRGLSIGNNQDVLTRYVNAWTDDLAWFGECKSAEWMRRIYANKDYSRTGFNCLHPPDGENTFELDLAEMNCSPSTMTIKLSNIKDPIDKTKYYFGKLLAPGRCFNSTNSALTFSVNPAATIDWISASATTLCCRNNTDFANSGIAHIGQETFSYTGKTTGFVDAKGNDYHKFTGCTRGLYPALSSTNMGKTFYLPSSSKEGENHAQPISNNPFALIGRRVGLYVTTWDEVNRKWFAESSAKLLWPGVISDQINFDSIENTWMLSCEFITKELDAEIGYTFNEATIANQISLTGDFGREIVAYETRGVSPTHNWCRFTIAAGAYSAQTLITAINTGLNTAGNWDAAPLGIYSFYIFGDKVAFQGIDIGGAANLYETRIWQDIDLFYTDYTGPVWHILTSLGFTRNINLIYENSAAWQDADENFYISYHPLSVKFNNRLYLESTTNMWLSQGDLSNQQAAVEIPDVQYIANDKSKGTVHLIYDGKQTSYLELADTQLFSDEDSRTMFVGARKGEEPIRVKQCYAPITDPTVNDIRGPFEILLYNILSTGTDGLNDATYDKLKYGLHLGIPVDIVDKTSFTEADKIIKANAGDLATRKYHIVNDTIDWMKDLFLPEAKLFGFALIWDNYQSKLSLRQVFGQDQNLVTTTLTDANMAYVDDKPRVVSSSNTIINKWEVQITWDNFTQKFGNVEIIKDIRSIEGANCTKVVKIENKGIQAAVTYESNGDIKPNKDLIEAFLLNTNLMGSPWWTLDRSLRKDLITKISLGDIVGYQSSLLPDPFGSGSFSVDTKAIVTRLGWNFRTFIGNCSLLIFSTFNPNELGPWACSAIATAFSGAPNYRLTLTALEFGLAGDSDDGADFKQGDHVDIVERSPGDPAAPLCWLNQTVAKDYEADGANLLTLSGALAAWDATKEYVVFPTGYSNATATQKANNIWQASVNNNKLNSVDWPYRYG